jgi:hypothetical protein
MPGKWYTVLVKGGYVMLELKVSPVRRAGTPGYPGREEVLARPGLLEKLPVRWQACRRAAAAAGLLATVSLAGCVPPPVTAGVPLPPPSLSEADAMALIGETARSYGLALKQDVDRAGISSKVGYLTLDQSDGKGYTSCDLRDGTRLDAWDAAKKVGFEYISGEAVASGSVDVTDAVAGTDPVEHLQGDGAVLVVYPVYEGGQDSLKAQVQEFLDWLKAEGVI